MVEETSGEEVMVGEVVMVVAEAVMARAVVVELVMARGEVDMVVTMVVMMVMVTVVMVEVKMRKEWEEE